MHVCPQCQGDRLVNNGSVARKPKKLCKQCGYQFTRTNPRGKPLVMKVHTVLLYLSGISMHRIAFLLRVSVQSVLNWHRTFAQERYEKPEPTGNAIISELDEIWALPQAQATEALDLEGLGSRNRSPPGLGMWSA
jgi:transposase-like protein